MKSINTFEVYLERLRTRIEKYGSEDAALTFFLIKGIVFINNGWWNEEEGNPWPKDAITVHVGCNDTFGYACADSEDISYSELLELYSMYKKDPNDGVTAWCIKKRKQLPIKPVEEWMRKAGIWDLDLLSKEEIKL